MLIALVIFIISIILLNAFVFSFIKINKTSMRPTLEDGNIVLLNRLAYRKHTPESGDIIVFRRNSESGIDYVVKRVIGIPGDKIDIKGENVYRNSILLDEPYVETPTVEDISFSIPKNCFFVLGDNRQASLDSRNIKIGFVNRNEIFGKVFFKFVPFNGIDIYSHEYADKK